MTIEGIETLLAFQKHTQFVQQQSGGGFFGAVWYLIGLAQLILCIWCIIDCVTKCKPDDRIIWILIILFVPVVGPIIYLFVAQRTGGERASDALMAKARALKNRRLSGGQEKNDKPAPPRPPRIPPRS